MTTPASSLLMQVNRYVRERDLLSPGARVVLGLSGGVDSITLAHLLQRLGYDVVAAHVNYGLRGDASDADEAFVRDWCAGQSPPIPVHVKPVRTKGRADETGRSVQALARNQRYAFFEAVALEVDAGAVAVAHHRDDQAETVLLNLFRGSGLEGLQGMPPRRPLGEGSSLQLVRPLLTASRAAIETYAKTHDLPWRTDASNRDLTYRRNAVRHDILPSIRDHFEGAPERIAHTAETLRQYVTHTFRPELDRRLDQCARSADGAAGALALAPLAHQPPVWRRRIVLEALRRWLPGAPQRAAFVAEVESLQDAQVGRKVACGAGTIWREREALRFVPAADRSAEGAATTQPQPIPWGTPVALPEGTLRIDPLPHVPAPTAASADATTAWVDADALDAPLTARRWQDGDRFQPLGMDGHKLVSDFLTDEQVPPHRRRRVLVLCADGQIVWVVGYRLAHPFRLRSRTVQAAQIAFEPSSASDLPAPL